MFNAWINQSKTPVSVLRIGLNIVAYLYQFIAPPKLRVLEIWPNWLISRNCGASR